MKHGINTHDEIDDKRGREDKHRLESKTFVKILATFLLLPTVLEVDVFG